MSVGFRYTLFSHCKYIDFLGRVVIYRFQKHETAKRANKLDLWDTLKSGLSYNKSVCGGRGQGAGWQLMYLAHQLSGLSCMEVYSHSLYILTNL